MPDPYLVGNGRWCSTCYPDGPPRTWVSSRATAKRSKQPRAGCNECVGAGRIRFSAEEIVAATVAEARSWWRRVA